MDNTIIHCFMTLVCVVLYCVQTVLTAGIKHACVDIKGQPAFWDTMENRCSPCSANVCENQRPLDCLCHCIMNYSELEYLPRERMMCEKLPSEQELAQGSIHQMSPLQDPGLLAWMIIVSIMVLIGYLREPCTKVWKKWRSKRHRPKPPEPVAPIYKVRVPLLAQNNDPPPPPKQQAAQPVKSPARNCRSPVQATPEHKPSDETNVKCSAGAGNPRGTSKTGPHPSQPQTYGNTEGVPGHKYQLLPQGDRTSTL